MQAGLVAEPDQPEVPDMDVHPIEEPVPEVDPPPEVSFYLFLVYTLRKSFATLNKSFHTLGMMGVALCRRDLQPSF